MAKTKKIFFPTKKSAAPTFVGNIHDKLTIGGLGLKYDISAADMTKSGNFNTDTPADYSASQAAIAVAQSLTNTSDAGIKGAKLFYGVMGHAMQRHTNFDPADLEATGMFKQEIPIDINAVVPVISQITSLPERMILDWVKGGLDGAYFEGIVQVGNNLPPNMNSAWLPLGEDDRSPFEDKRINVGNTPETRYYRLRLKKDNKPVGQYSGIYNKIAEIYS